VKKKCNQKKLPNYQCQVSLYRFEK